MKKGIIINLLLILLIYIIPKPNIEISEVKAEIQETIQQATEVVAENIDSSRGLEQMRTETEKKEVVKNLELKTDSDLRVISNLTEEEFNKMLAGTELYGIGGTLVKIEKEYSINGLYMLGLSCLESNYGKSKYARKRNNLVGWNAIDSNPDKATYFESKESCLLFVAEKLKTNYLSENGCYFNGFTGRAVDKKYCTDKKHIDKICQIIKELEKKL